MNDVHPDDAELLDVIDLGLGSDAGPELIFWRRQALMRAKRVADLEAEVRRLRAVLYEIGERIDEVRP